MDGIGAFAVAVGRRLDGGISSPIVKAGARPLSLRSSPSHRYRKPGTYRIWLVAQADVAFVPGHEVASPRRCASASR